MTRASLVFLCAAAAVLAQPPPPKQPLPFSHKQHVAAGLLCKECHANADPGESMGFPGASKCMSCHIAIAKERPAIQRLKLYAQEKQAIPWVRVYEIPGYVSFSHRTHLEAGADCENCHGPVSQRDALAKEGSIAMGACMDCHRKREASNACNLCHEPR